MSYRKLNLGCGTDCKIDYLNVDIINLEGVDIVHDLNIFPYPFVDNEFEQIIMNDVLEHLDNPIEVLQECWRILKKGGTCKLRVVYWNHQYSYSDPQHKHAFSEIYFKFFVGLKRKYYMKYHFDGLEIEYIFDNKAMQEYGNKQKALLEKAYHHCNIIQGMLVKLIK